MDNVQALKNLYVQLGGDSADVANISTNAGMINAIAGLDIGGGSGSVIVTLDCILDLNQDYIESCGLVTNAEMTITVPEEYAGKHGTCLNAIYYDNNETFSLVTFWKESTFEADATGSATVTVDVSNVYSESIMQVPGGIPGKVTLIFV